MTEFYEKGGKAHPIRSSKGYSSGKAGEKRKRRVIPSVSHPPQKDIRGEIDKVNKHDLMTLWTTSRTAVGNSRYDRMQWSAKEYAKAHPGTSKVAAYKALDRYLD